MAPKSAAALVRLAAMIASLAAPPLQAQRLDAMILFVVNKVCPGDDVMRTCALVVFGSVGTIIPPDCCGALLEAVTSGKGKRCACGLGKVTDGIMGVDVFRRCQAANNAGAAGGPSNMKELCMRVPGN
ncbi:hypothetical protein SEVIR_8G233700v4 [Setaria viridis]|uniref:Bifunctional inhibitor/plant lipid transfer protein/seed storage helical domain-containing protein n=1 Tax=Setaria viridis TaxID=4556 RepID=A0A4U6TIL6_SETVI|nr:hypothetical protein SEVIR_8G233700v2 [Setaria viridis]